MWHTVLFFRALWWITLSLIFWWEADEWNDHTGIHLKCLVLWRPNAEICRLCWGYEGNFRISSSGELLISLAHVSIAVGPPKDDRKKLDVFLVQDSESISGLNQFLRGKGRFNLSFLLTALFPLLYAPTPTPITQFRWKQITLELLCLFLLSLPLSLQTCNNK